jgi:hypothetical protein
MTWMSQTAPMPDKNWEILHCKYERWKCNAHIQMQGNSGDILTLFEVSIYFKNTTNIEHVVKKHDLFSSPES